MPLYVADYRADTAHLTAAEHGAYLLLIMHYWQNGGLPDDDGKLSRIACMSASEWLQAKETITSFFGPGWKHKRIDSEIEKAEAVSAAASQAGIASGRARRARAERPLNDRSNETPTDVEPPHPHPPSQPPRNDLFGKGGMGGREQERPPPRHLTRSQKHGTIFILRDSEEWRIYADDFKAVRDAEPIPNRHGGYWFVLLGEASRRETRGRLERKSA